MINGFHYTDEQLMLKEAVRKFSEKEIAPLVKWMENRKEDPRDLTKRLKIWVGVIQYPEKYGGTGNSYVEYVMQLRSGYIVQPPAPFR